MGLYLGWLPVGMLSDKNPPIRKKRWAYKNIASACFVLQDHLNITSVCWNEQNKVKRRVPVFNRTGAPLVVSSYLRPSR